MKRAENYLLKKCDCVDPFITKKHQCIEVTPKVIRMRKVILNEDDRKKTQKSQQVEAV